MSQFHYGMIQIKQEVCKTFFFGMSQFHYGMIQIIGFTGTLAECKEVSIPLWYDSNKSMEGMVDTLFTVSIPLWYDSNSGA